MTFLGIDPTAGERPFTYVALDQELSLLALGQGSIDEILAFAGGQQQAYVAVCAPRQPNQGVMRREDVRQSLSPQPKPGHWNDFRLADYLVRQHNISIPQTPADESLSPRWMQMGFMLHRKLHAMDYAFFPTEGKLRQVLEVYPYAAYAVLLGVLPLPKHSLEGRLQRQLALYEEKVRISDPMDFFEEITRHRLLRGILPLDDLHTPAELDALVAAYTAWKAALHPEKILLIGDAQEGQVVLPVSELKPKFESLGGIRTG